MYLLYTCHCCISGKTINKTFFPKPLECTPYSMLRVILANYSARQFNLMKSNTRTEFAPQFFRRFSFLQDFVGNILKTLFSVSVEIH